MTHWGKAGQRLTPDQLRARQAPRRAARALTDQQDQARTHATHRTWAAGRVRPDLITTWLDHRGLDGPGVDTACGVTEPTVDLWEAGWVYPTWDQLQALARLCQVPVWRFTDHRAGLPDRIFLCGRGAPRGPAPVTTFCPLALAAAGI